MRKLIGAAALAIALATLNSPAHAADIASCPPAPVIEDPMLRTDLDGKVEYLKWIATSRDDASRGLAVMLENYSAGVERQLATESVRHTICVMARDPGNDLTPDQREVLESLLPNAKTR